MLANVNDKPKAYRAIAEYYAGIAPAIDARAEQLAGEGQRHDPLLARLAQIEETFARLENDLRTGLTRGAIAAGGVKETNA